jgi:hypothetical protein
MDKRRILVGRLDWSGFQRERMEAEKGVQISD